ncbi:MAG: T9SS type A sorting domain-containing protein, partial [Bacteroidota bacterium]
LDLGIVQLGVTTGFDVFGLITEGGGHICASLDVPGAPVHVSEPSCDAFAGTLKADSSIACFEDHLVISAHPNGDAVVPEGFSTIYVLTQGEGLVIVDVNIDPSFTVGEGGNYTIHTLVYDPNTLDLGIVQLGVTTGFDVFGLITEGGGEICASLDVAGAPVTVEDPDAGTLTANEGNVTLEDGSATISATSNGDANVPEGYNTIYVLTQGEGLVIVNVNTEAPSFEVTEAGNYTIHTLIYDPSTLDLGIVQLGVTTGFDVFGLITEGGGHICASLDVPGAPVHVSEPSCDAFAGTLVSYDPVQCLEGGHATIYAEVDESPIIPEGFTQLYVLTRAFSLTILDVSATPEFTVSNVGFYRIHSLIYDANTLDLSIVQFGHTTAFDVLPLLVQGGGEICASLDVHGAVSLVLPRFICQFFNNSHGRSAVTPSDMVANYMETYGSYEAFEKGMLNEFSEVTMYPNPVKNQLTISTELFEGEQLAYQISDIQGRLLTKGIVDETASNGLNLDVSRLRQGTYVVKLISKYRTVTEKIQVVN